MDRMEFSRRFRKTAAVFENPLKGVKGTLAEIPDDTGAPSITQIGPDEYLDMVREGVRAEEAAKRREPGLVERLAPAGPDPLAEKAAKAAGIGPVGSFALGAGAASVALLAAYAIARHRASTKSKRL